MRRIPRDIKKILFVCTGNSCRSVMAEGLFQKMLREAGKDIKVSSAGVSALAGMDASHETLSVLKQDGIDLSRHRARRVSRELIDTVDLIVVMQTHHREAILAYMPEAQRKVHLLTSFASNSNQSKVEDGIPDPIGLGEAYYVQIKDVIFKHLQALYRELNLP